MSKLNFLEDLELPDFPIEWFIDLAIKPCNHIVKKDLVHCKFVNFDFLKKAKVSFIEKLENFGCVILFYVSD